MKKFALAIMAAIVALTCSLATTGVFAESENEKELKYISFLTQTDADWSSFSWGDAGAACTVDKSLVEEYSKDEDKSLKVVKTVTLTGNSFAAVYYQQLGAKTEALNVTEPYGLRFTVYSPEAVSGGLGFKFGNVEQSDITCVHENSDEVLTSRDLNYTGYRTYTVPFTPELDISAVNELQIFIWGEVSVTLYISDLSLIYTGEIIGEPVEPPAPQPPELGDYSLMLSSFEESDFAKWSKSGQSGTVYTTARNTDKTFVKDGDSSLKYTWQNPLYAFGWTETYLEVSEIIEKNSQAGLTGISFDIYNTSEQTVGEVGFWVKVAEADGSEYEVDPSLLVNGTKLDFTGWNTVEIPFSAFTPDRLASYSQDENGKFDADQLAYIKIGLWSNSKEVVETEIFLDTLKLHALRELDDGTPAPTPSNEGCKGCNAGLSGVGCSVLVLTVAVGVVLLKIKRRRGE